jgi:hypothetical protein
VRDMLLMISLGAGRFVGWSVRELFIGGIRRGIEFRGRRWSGQPYDPLFHHLNLKAALELATKNYSHELGERTGLGIAIEWYVMSQPYSEARYLATMTALEHIVAKHADVLGAMLPLETFQAVRGDLDGVLSAPHTRAAVVAALRADGLTEAELSAAADSRIAALRSKLGGLNSVPLQDKIIALLSMYGVQHSDVTPTLQQLLAIRNRLVHRGLHRRDVGGVALATAVAALRELVVRMILAILNYEGPYQSYLNGPTTAHFAKRPS